MKLKELTDWLENEVPLSFQENYDNSGLQTGDTDTEITSALIVLDVTLPVIEEAIRNKCNLIISHHPVIFGGIKNITTGTLTGRILTAAIRNNIAIYSSHTNLDNASNGVSRKMAEKLGLSDINVLSPLQGKLLKLVTYVPVSHFEDVRNAVFSAGAGVIGNYDSCGFSVEGSGSFKGNDLTKPFAGSPGIMHHEKELRFETILYSHIRNRVIRALLESHPYEEVAYDIYELQNDNHYAGSGCTGIFPVPLNEADFLRLVSSAFDARGIRHSGLTGKQIRKVAMCGGSGSSFIGDAIKSGADAFVTGDIKYHDFFKAGERLLIVDAGHFETEKYSNEILKDLIIKKFPKFAVRFSEINTNPINYF